MGIKEKIAGLGTKTLVMMLAFIAVVSAATVAYLSTAATATVNVSSPLAILFDGTTPAATISLTGTSSDTFNFAASLRNSANNDVPAITKMTCTGTDLTCGMIAVKEKLADRGLGFIQNIEVYSSTSAACVSSLNTATYTFNQAMPIAEYTYEAGAGSSAPYGYTYTIDATFSPDSATGLSYDGTVECQIQAFPA